jgi:hypothetical protein
MSELPHQNPSAARRVVWLVVHRLVALALGIGLALLVARYVFGWAALGAYVAIASLLCAIAWWAITRSTSGVPTWRNYAAGLVLAFRGACTLPQLKWYAVASAVGWAIVGAATLACAGHLTLPGDRVGPLVSRWVIVCNYIGWAMLAFMATFLIVHRLTCGYRGSTADKVNTKLILACLGTLAAGVGLHAIGLGWLGLILSCIAIVAVTSPLWLYGMFLLHLATTSRPVRWN